MAKKLNEKELQSLSREELKTYATQQGVVFRSKDDSKTIIRKVLNHLNDNAGTVRTSNISTTKIKKEVPKKDEKSSKSTTKPKETNKTTEKVETNLNIILKQVGNNLILTANGRAYTKVVKDSDKRNEIKQKVSDFLKNKTQGQYDHLVSIFAEVSSGDINAKKEKIRNIITKDITKVEEPVKQEEKKKLEEEVKSTPVAAVPTKTTTRRGEW